MRNSFVILLSIIVLSCNSVKKNVALNKSKTIDLSDISIQKTTNTKDSSRIISIIKEKSLNYIIDVPNDSNSKQKEIWIDQTKITVPSGSKVSIGSNERDTKVDETKNKVQNDELDHSEKKSVSESKQETLKTKQTFRINVWVIIGSIICFILIIVLLFKEKWTKIF